MKIVLSTLLGLTLSGFAHAAPEDATRLRLGKLVSALTLLGSRGPANARAMLRVALNDPAEANAVRALGLEDETVKFLLSQANLSERRLHPALTIWALRTNQQPSAAILAIMDRLFDDLGRRRGYDQSLGALANQPARELVVLERLFERWSFRLSIIEMDRFSDESIAREIEGLRRDLDLLSVKTDRWTNDEMRKDWADVIARTCALELDTPPGAKP